MATISVDEATRAQLQAELVPLCTLWAKFGEIHQLGGCPFGTRVVADVADFRIDGERLKGRMRSTAVADWASLGADGTCQLDVRATMESDDGALIYIQYNGRCDLSAGFESPGPVYAAPRFETGDPRYAWLNKVQAVQKGKYDFAKGEIVYQVYEVR